MTSLSKQTLVVSLVGALMSASLFLGAALSGAPIA